MHTYFITLIGTDGAGKTTLGELLEEKLGINCKYVYFGLKEFELKWVNYLLKIFGSDNLFMRVFIIPIGYIYRRNKLKQSTVVILDRIPGWAFTIEKSALYYIYKYILPNADYLILCSGRPDVILGRKAGRDIAGIEKDIKKFH